MFNQTEDNFKITNQDTKRCWTAIFTQTSLSDMCELFVWIWHIFVKNPFKDFTPLKAETNMSQVKNKKTFCKKKCAYEIFTHSNQHIFEIRYTWAFILLCLTEMISFVHISQMPILDFLFKFLGNGDILG